MGLDKAAQEHPWIPAQLEQQLEQGKSTGGPGVPPLPFCHTQKAPRFFSRLLPEERTQSCTVQHSRGKGGLQLPLPWQEPALGTGDRGDTALGDTLRDTPRDTPDLGDTPWK